MHDTHIEYHAPGERRAIGYISCFDPRRYSCSRCGSCTQQPLLHIARAQLSHVQLLQTVGLSAAGLVLQQALLVKTVPAPWPSKLTDRSEMSKEKQIASQNTMRESVRTMRFKTSTRHLLIDMKELGITSDSS